MNFLHFIPNKEISFVSFGIKNKQFLGKTPRIVVKLLNLIRTNLATKFALPLFIILYPGISFSQKQFSDQFNTWIAYSGNHKLSEKYRLHTEYQWRRSEFMKHWQQSLARIGIDYYFNNSDYVSVGYGWIVTFPYGEQPILRQFNEHRFWQQLNLKSISDIKIRSIEVQHRYRLEQRFLENYYINSSQELVKGETSFRQRIRYRAMLLIPLNKRTLIDKTLFLNVNDEVFLGFGEGIGKNILDQNRFNVSMGWKFDNNFNIQVGYMNQFIVKSDGVKIERNHTFLSSISYSLDFSIKK